MSVLRNIPLVRLTLMLVAACMLLHGVLAASALAAMDAKRLTHKQSDLPFELVICTPEGVKTLGPAAPENSGDTQDCQSLCATLCASGATWDGEVATDEGQTPFRTFADAGSWHLLTGQSPPANAGYRAPQARAPPV